MIIIQLTPDQLSTLLQHNFRKVLEELPHPQHPQPLPQEEDEFISIKQASVKYDRPESTFRGMIQRKVVPFYKHGNMIYFKVSELNELIAFGRKRSMNEIQNAVTEYRSHKKAQNV